MIPVKKITHPLVLVWIAVASLGGALIALKFSGTTLAWVLGIPAIAAFGLMVPGMVGGALIVADGAYEDISNWVSTGRQWIDTDDR